MTKCQRCLLQGSIWLIGLSALGARKTWPPILPAHKKPNTAAPCPSPSTAGITCTPVSCLKAGAIVPLVGTCNSTLPNAPPITYYVDGVASQNLTCAPPGTTVTVEPTLEGYGNITACSYAAASYTVTSQCPAAAGFQCGQPNCDAPGKVIPLAGLCTAGLTGATVVYSVNGVAQQSQLQCPAAGASATIVPSVVNYLGQQQCSYTGSAINVTCEILKKIVLGFHTVSCLRTAIQPRCCAFTAPKLS